MPSVTAVVGETLPVEVLQLTVTLGAPWPAVLVTRAMIVSLPLPVPGPGGGWKFWLVAVLTSW